MKKLSILIFTIVFALLLNQAFGGLIIRAGGGYSYLTSIIIEPDDPISRSLLESTSGFSANGGVGYDVSLANMGDLSIGLTALLNVNYQSLYGKMTTNILANITVEDTLSTLKLGLALEPYVGYKIVPGVKVCVGATLQPSYRILANHFLKTTVEFMGTTTSIETNFNILTNDNNLPLAVAPVVGANFDIAEGIALIVRLGYEIELTKLISDNASKIISSGNPKVNASVNSFFGNVSVDLKLF